jgi:putative hydrolase of HD superfamily
LAEHANEDIDVLKVVTMLLIHDIVEIDAGDTYAYDTAGNATKRQRELAAADRIFNLLPKDQAVKLRGLWDEFEAYETIEARFAHTMDNMQPLMLNDATGGRAWREHQVHDSQVYGRNKRTHEGSEILWQYMEGLIKKNVEMGNIQED